MLGQWRMDWKGGYQ